MDPEDLRPEARRQGGYRLTVVPGPRWRAPRSTNAAAAASSTATPTAL
jgi:hypothetical protein